MYQIIRQAIIDKLNSSAVKLVKVAYRTDRSKIDAYPAALVFPSQQEADFFQTAPQSNKEEYVFTIRLLFPFTEGQDKADIALEKTVDELLTVFRDRNVLGSAADWVSPVPSVWGYQDRGAGQFRIAELKIRVVKYVQG